MNDLAYPWFLLMFLPFAVLVVYAWRKPLPSLRISSVKPFSKAQGGRRPFASRIPFILYALGTALLVFALARPREGTEISKQRAEGIDIILAVDLSGSMSSYDVSDKIKTEQQLATGINDGYVWNRLQVAKREIKKFIEKRPNDRIGLICFAQQPFSACPPTLDHAFLMDHLKQLQPGMIGDATGIAGPIANAIHRLKDSDSKRRVLVLFTDGANNVNARITPRMAAKLADDEGVVIYTVGIGSDRAYMISNTIFGKRLTPFRGEFDEKLLKDIADLSHGQYYAAKDAKGLGEVMEEINKMEKTTVEQQRIVNYKELAPDFIIAAIILLLFAFILENTLFISLP